MPHAIKPFNSEQKYSPPCKRIYHPSCRYSNAIGIRKSFSFLLSSALIFYAMNARYAISSSSALAAMFFLAFLLRLNAGVPVVRRIGNHSLMKTYRYCHDCTLRMVRLAWRYSDCASRCRSFRNCTVASEVSIPLSLGI